MKESNTTANINIERYILALHTLAFRFMHMRNVEQTSTHTIDLYLTQGGFTLVYGEYVAPRMAQVEESLRARIEQCDGDTRRAFIAETAQRCERIGEAYRGLKRAQEPCYSQGEKIGGVTMRVSGYKYQILKCQMAEVSEGVLEIFPSFVELFNRLCVYYGCGAPLVDPLGRDSGGRDSSNVAVVPSEDKNIVSPYEPLTQFIEGGTENIAYIMKYKQPQHSVKLLWTADKGDVLLFHDILGWAIPEINRCIRFKGGKKISLSNRKKNGTSTLLSDILQGFK